MNRKLMDESQQRSTQPKQPHEVSQTAESATELPVTDSDDDPPAESPDRTWVEHED
jgi:hypothetical protein